MIISEDAPTSPLKGQQPEFPAQIQQPPSYGATTQNQGPIPRLQTQAPYPASAQPYSVPGSSYAHIMVPPSPHYPDLDPHERRRIRRKTTKRFCEAFLIAILIWVLVTMLVQSIMSVARFTGRHWNNYEVPNGIDLDYCAVPEKGDLTADPISLFPYWAHTSFELPVSAEALIFLARGTLSNGQIRVTKHGQSEHVKVDITIRYHREDVLGEAKICKLTRNSGEVGVGIITPRWWPGRGYDENLYFDVDVSLPVKTTRRLGINNFETDLPMFKHLVEDLSKTVYFQNIDLKSSNFPIFVEHISAENIEAESSNGPISGKYDAINSITLKTSNAPIEVEVDLTATKSEAELFMETSNNRLQADVRLHSKGKVSSSGDRFLLRGVSSNSGIHLDIKDMPLGSTLHLESKTSNGLANVWLPPAFEGSYILQTSNSPPHLISKRKEDPWGRGRTRHVDSRQVQSHMEGSVYWDEANKEKSSVSVKSSNAPVTIYL
ncbi:hypothetical protein Moror_17875 [Moniliophthora roreri MCA 2997]|uniref:DUF7330 domain-containing protein n=1 Tax=Moniliophthora roreri (strain MCA 2997) TaxID=1381753 RepID=V2YZT9_MONRO|nr:hypothetical protein Moror_17875 [Moniliophthora roreri MCA 2997]